MTRVWRFFFYGTVTVPRGTRTCESAHGYAAHALALGVSCRRCELSTRFHLTRKQELEELKNSRLDFFVDYDNPLSELRTDRVWTREKSQFDIWLHRAERFQIRLWISRCAPWMRKRRGAGYVDTRTDSGNSSTVNSFLDGTRHRRIFQNTLDCILGRREHHRNVPRNSSVGTDVTFWRTASPSTGWSRLVRGR